MDFSQCRHRPELFEWGLSEVVSELKPERAFIACRQKSDGSDFPTAYATQGFSLANLYTHEDISTEVVRQTLRRSEGKIEVDAISNPELSLHTSVVLSGLRSIITIPLRHPSGLNLGLVYADSRCRTGAFNKAHLAFLEELAGQMVDPLGTIEKREREEPTDVLSEEPFEDVKRRSLALFKDGDLQTALSLIEEWAQGKPPGFELGMAHGIRGRFLEQSGELRQAVEAMSLALWMIASKATSANEDYGLMLNNLAGVHVKLGNLERAAGLLTTSAQNWRQLKLPEDRQLGGLAAACYNLGALELKRRQAGAAVPHLEDALQASQAIFGVDHAKTAKIRETLEQARSA